MPRSGVPYRSYGPARPPYPSQPYYRSSYPSRWHYPVRPYYYPRPYYSFRPRISIGFGLWVGYPVAYPYYGYAYPYYGYAYPYAYGTPYPSYGYPPPAAPPSVGVVPGSAAYGGVSFEVTPAEAAVYVDGAYAGVVADFMPNAKPLTLSPGRHRVEVQAPGYEPIVLDVDVLAGQVIPYQGAMIPVRP